MCIRDSSYSYSRFGPQAAPCGRRDRWDYYLRLPSTGSGSGLPCFKRASGPCQDLREIAPIRGRASRASAPGPTSQALRPTDGSRAEAPASLRTCGSRRIGPAVRLHAKRTGRPCAPSPAAHRPIDRGTPACAAGAVRSDAFRALCGPVYGALSGLRPRKPGRNGILNR